MGVRLEEIMRNLSPILLLLVTIAGCGNPFEFSPDTTVILKLSGLDDDVKREQIADEAKELVLERSTWHMIQTSKHNDTVMIKVSPVDDVQEFADRITFGEVTSVEENIVYVDVP
jgi:predicted small lipoprotein YifL